jgi:hypothetical protein
MNVVFTSAGGVAVRQTADGSYACSGQYKGLTIKRAIPIEDGRRYILLTRLRFVSIDRLILGCVCRLFPSSANCYRFSTAGHITIPTAHRIEPTLHWSPAGRAAYYRSMSFPRTMDPQPNWSRAGFATSTAMVSASSPSISALGVRSPRYRSGAMPRSLFASVNSSASGIGRSPQLPGRSCASSRPPANRKT